MKFWDTSAVIPLLVSEPHRDRLLALLEEDGTMIVWWGTPLECMSAIARRERQGHLRTEASTQALERLRALQLAWQEITPSTPVRGAMQRLLRVHPLRTADALQLAAAVVAAEHEPAGLDFVSLDNRLNVAAQKEGFNVVRPYAAERSTRSDQIPR